MSQPTDPLAYSLSDAVQLTGLSLNTIRRLADDGALHTVKVGKRRLIPADELRRLVEQGTEGAA